ncbi:MAG: hypothetical protein J2P50_15255 [Hyphomicrobiaceae bacterium]|nr:hypothetical protein [Hyphomicrobiaceae bacterium]
MKPGGTLFAATNGDAHVGRIDALVNEYLGDVSPVMGGLAFSLENGAVQLSPFFASIAVEYRCGTLRITEPEAVVDYVLSFDAAKEASVGDRLDACAVAREDVGSAGALVVRTRSGLFVARKA